MTAETLNFSLNVWHANHCTTMHLHTHQLFFQKIVSCSVDMVFLSMDRRMLYYLEIGIQCEQAPFRGCWVKRRLQAEKNECCLGKESGCPLTPLSLPRPSSVCFAH